MYIRELHLKNIKLFRDLHLSFSHEGKPRMWTAIVGENGLCKTTLLQAIALAASGRDRANQLASVPSLPDRRKPKENAEIHARFSFSDDFHEWRRYPGQTMQSDEPPWLRTHLTLAPNKRIFRGGSEYTDTQGKPLDRSGLELNPLEEARAGELNHWFVTGYGVQRMLPIPMSSQEPDDPYLNRLNSLFGPRQLIATGFADLLPLEDAREYSRTLRQALIDHGLLPLVAELELRGRGGVRRAADLLDAHRFVLRAGGTDLKLPATWLSHGYQGMIAWIADLIGQVFLEAGEPVPLELMEGLVLIDELDLHLHPRWQADLVSKLKHVFPGLQFVITTHSPMLLPGFEKHEIIRLVQDDEGNVVAAETQQSPALMTGSEIYESFFGIDQLYPSELGEALRRYDALANDPERSDEEEREMHELLQKLRDAQIEPDWQPVPRPHNADADQDPEGGAPT